MRLTYGGNVNHYGYWFVSAPWIGTPEVLILRYPRGCRNSPLGYLA
nr:MAG TPA: hypothetical protein [Caudoviricetes sp.]